jgi:hypothetical protein
MQIRMQSFSPLGVALRFALMCAIVMACLQATSFAQLAINVAVSFAPPPIPVYDQPLCPGDGYMWTPGFWAYDPDIDDYYWVPGTWVMAPEVGFLWTPGWWGWGDGGFFFHDGYWGPVVGFYGGINYGFGYFGAGFEGGRWDHDHFFYNRSIMNVNVTEIHNVYNENVVVHNDVRVSYNGGEGGVNRRPTPEEEAAARDRHVPPVQAQLQHVQGARSNPQLRASANMGKPPIAATPRPGDFKDRGVVEAKDSGGHWTPPPNRGANRPGASAATPRPENNAERPSTPTHVRELPPAERPAAPNTGNAKQDQKYQQQQEKLYAQQQKERQKVAQQQENEDQKLAKQNASEAQKQQQEQRHQQQTQQLQQKHQQQQKQMQQRVQPRPQPASKPPK